MSNELQSPAGATGARLKVSAALERLHKLYPRMIDLKIDRLQRLLADLGDPQTKLPPVILSLIHI